MCDTQGKNETLNAGFFQLSTDEPGKIVPSTTAMDTFRQAIPNLYSVPLREIKGLISSEEVSPVLDVSNGLLPVPMLLGQQLRREVQDDIDRNGFAEGWGFARDALLETLARLSSSQVPVLETVLNDSWYAPDVKLEIGLLLEVSG